MKTYTLKDIVTTGQNKTTGQLVFYIKIRMMIKLNLKPKDILNLKLPIRK